jgi:hypothetical protein
MVFAGILGMPVELGRVADPTAIFNYSENNGY